MRHGFSLLEVLVAIFVILVGLLGVVALIPVGHSSMLKATQADRSRTLATNSIQEIRIRGWSSPEWWCWPDGTDFDETTFSAGVVVFDPLFCASNPSTNLFPAGVANGLARVSLWSVPPPQGASPPFSSPHIPMSSALADRLFRSSDDLIFSREDDARPVAVPGATVAVASKGEYSWFATVTASVSGSAIPFAADNTVTVATAICYQRNIVDDESVIADVVWPAGVFIGEFDLVFATQENAAVIDDATWIAVMRTDRLGVQWYRITRLEDVDSAVPLHRTVYLEGAEWPIDGTQLPPQPLMPARAIIVPSVLSVKVSHLAW